MELLKRQKLAFEELAAVHMLARGMDLDGAPLSSEARDNLKMQLPLVCRPEYETEVPPWIDVALESGNKFSHHEAEATRLKVLVSPLLTANGSIQTKSMPQFVQLMGEAESEGEVYYITMVVLARCDQYALKARFVEAGGLDRLLGFIQEGTKRRIPNLILWTLKVLEKLPPTETLLKHQIASAVKNISMMDGAGSKELKDAATTVLRVWLKEKNALTGKPPQPPPSNKPANPSPPVPRQQPQKKVAASSAAAPKAPARPAAPAPSAPRPPTASPVAPRPASKSATATRPAAAGAAAGSFSSALMAAPAPAVKKKKRPTTVPPAAVAAPEKKARMISLDAKGEVMSPETQQRDNNVVVEVASVVLSADDLIARQRKPSRLGVPVIEKKPQTAAALAAKMRDERQEKANTAAAASSSASYINAMSTNRNDDGEDFPQLDSNLEAELFAVPPVKTTKRVTFAPDDKLVEIRKYTPENPTQMLSTRSALSGVREYAKMDVQKEKVLKTQKTDESSAKDLAKRMEAQIEWYRPPELRVVYSEDDEPPKRGEESTEKATLKARDETRMGRVYNEKNAPPDDPVEAPAEPDYDEASVPQLRTDPDPAALPVAAAAAMMNPLAGLLSNPNLSSLIESPIGGFMMPVMMQPQMHHMQHMQHLQHMQQQQQPLPPLPPVAAARRYDPPPREGNKVGLCNFWNHGKGECRFGSTCRFIHD